MADQRLSRAERDRHADAHEVQYHAVAPPGRKTPQPVRHPESSELSGCFYAEQLLQLLGAAERIVDEYLRAFLARGVKTLTRWTPQGEKENGHP